MINYESLCHKLWNNRWSMTMEMSLSLRTFILGGSAYPGPSDLWTIRAYLWMFVKILWLNKSVNMKLNVICRGPWCSMTRLGYSRYNICWTRRMNQSEWWCSGSYSSVPVYLRVQVPHDLRKPAKQIRMNAQRYAVRRDQHEWMY
jgi:hypothetical protein